jgi:hypothetical protein
MQGSAAESAHRTITDFPRDRALQGLVDACLHVGKYQPGELLRWLVDDVLADFGLPKEAPAPDDIRDWIRSSVGVYADLVARFPFVDVLGHVYQSIGSRGHRGALGQFFTPPSVSTLVGSMLVRCLGSSRRWSPGKGLRAGMRQRRPSSSRSCRRRRMLAAPARCAVGRSPPSTWTCSALACARLRFWRTCCFNGSSWANSSCIAATRSVHEVGCPW